MWGFNFLFIPLSFFLGVYVKNQLVRKNTFYQIGWADGFEAAKALFKKGGS